MISRQTDHSQTTYYFCLKNWHTHTHKHLLNIFCGCKISATASTSLKGDQNRLSTGIPCYCTYTDKQTHLLARSLTFQVCIETTTTVVATTAAVAALYSLQTYVSKMESATQKSPKKRIVCRMRKVPKRHSRERKNTYLMWIHSQCQFYIMHFVFFFAPAVVVVVRFRQTDPILS